MWAWGFLKTIQVLTLETIFFCSALCIATDFHLDVNKVSWFSCVGVSQECTTSHHHFNNEK